MIKRITATGEFGESMTLKLTEPIDSGVWSYDADPTKGIFITEIEGLGPVKADINMTEIATQHGSVYNSARAKSRDITFHFLFFDMNGATAEDSRQFTYRVFPLGRKTSLVIETENRKVWVNGYVESNEPDIFAEQAGATITVNCPSAWMNVSGSAGTQSVEFSNLLSEFEFAEHFDPETSTYIADFEDSPTPSIIFSSIQHNTHHEFYYNGEVEVGMLITIVATNRFKNPTIYNVVNNKKLKINTDVIEKFLADNELDVYIDISTEPPREGHTGIFPGDEIRISTVEGNKYIRYYLFSETTGYNMLSALSEDSDWLTLLPGNNTYGYSCEKINGSDTDINLYLSLEAKVLVQGV